jgi:3-oxoacyl-[acyl-carrier protein] reductase
MPDRYQQLVNTPIGKLVSKQVGLPDPPILDRYRPGQPVIAGPVLFGAPAASGAPRLAPAVLATLKAIEARVSTPRDEALRTTGAEVGLDASIFNPDAGGEQRFKGLLLDATGLGTSEELLAAYAFFHGAARRVSASGRMIVLGTPPQATANPEAAVTQRALEGLVRSLGKEARGGATAQLVYVAPGAEDQLESTLRFLLSPRSAYVSGQVIRVGERVAAGKPDPDLDWATPLTGKVALVTGAARGIGAAIAEVLARDGASVVGLDIEPMAGELAAVTGAIGGTAMTADVTAEDAPAQIAERLLTEHEGVDIVVHNAGVTRDKTIGRMTDAQWSTVLGINLIAPQRITAELIARKAIRRNGRVVCLSSMNGIAGAAGQTNYATSKAGLIGFVEAQAPLLAPAGITVNAVAPGFIETPMTAAMPFGPREAGRRMNSLSQGGLPIDVAETIAWFAWPGSAGVTGNVVRVCGQSLVGA